jgi:hypothetical protein
MSTHFDAYDFAEWYWNISLSDGGSVSINKYLIAIASAALTGKQANITNLFTAAVAARLGPKSGPFARAKIGKATPEDFSHIFDMGVESGHFDKLKTTPQKWADANVGVDCTGFAVAYYDTIGLLEITRGVYSGGVGCPWLLSTARKNKHPTMTDVLIWDFGDVEADDMILWMYAGGKESRSPGHISIVWDTDSATSILYCAESSGSPDNSGHYGPRHTERLWKGVKGSGAGKYVDLGGAAVIIVRPPARFP